MASFKHALSLILLLGGLSMATNVCLVHQGPAIVNEITILQNISLHERNKLLLAARLKSPPTVPNCFDIADLGAETRCLSCQSIAAGTAATAYLECGGASFGCGPFEPLCAAACIAVATYALYAADQACYCLNADCSKDSVKAHLGGKPPAITIGSSTLWVDGSYVPGSTRTVGGKGSRPAQCAGGSAPVTTKVISVSS